MRTIGEVADALGLKTHILRYWEDQFPALNPLKRSGGRRLYRPEDVALVARIDRLVNREGYTLKGARMALAGGGSAAAVPVPEPVLPLAEAVSDAGGEAAEILDLLRGIRNRLASALQA